MGFGRLKRTHVQGDVDAAKEVVGVLLGARCRGAVSAHRLGYLLKIPAHRKQNAAKRVSSQIRLLLSKVSDVDENEDGALAVVYLPIPRSPLTSLSFLQASATDTSSSWSLQRSINSAPT